MAYIFGKMINYIEPISHRHKEALGNYSFQKLNGLAGHRIIYEEKRMVIWILSDYLVLKDYPAIRKTDADEAAGFMLALEIGSNTMGSYLDMHPRLEGGLRHFKEIERDLSLISTYLGIAGVRDYSSNDCIIDGLRFQADHLFVCEQICNILEKKKQDVRS